MAIQPKAYDISGEWSPELAARVDELFQILFNDLLSGTLDISAAQLTDLIMAAQGGTGLSSYVVGDLLYASAVAALARVADVATGNALISGGIGAAPAYGKIGLATHVSGDLPFANLVPASAASKLLGRGAAAGAGDFQEVSLGSGLTMTGTTLSASLTPAMIGTRVAVRL